MAYYLVRLLHLFTGKSYVIFNSDHKYFMEAVILCIAGEDNLKVEVK